MNKGYLTKIRTLCKKDIEIIENSENINSDGAEFNSAYIYKGNILIVINIRNEKYAINFELEHWDKVNKIMVTYADEHAIDIKVNVTNFLGLFTRVCRIFTNNLLATYVLHHTYIYHNYNNILIRYDYNTYNVYETNTNKLYKCIEKDRKPIKKDGLKPRYEIYIENKNLIDNQAGYKYELIEDTSLDEHGIYHMEKIEE